MESNITEPLYLLWLQGSFIHVSDYSGPEQLGEYLNYLDRNDTAYSQYFRWKGTGGHITSFVVYVCVLSASVK